MASKKEKDTIIGFKEINFCRVVKENLSINRLYGETRREGRPRAPIDRQEKIGFREKKVKDEVQKTLP